MIQEAHVYNINNGPKISRKSRSQDHEYELSEGPTDSGYSSIRTEADTSKPAAPTFANTIVFGLGWDSWKDVNNDDEIFEGFSFGQKGQKGAKAEYDERPLVSLS